MPVIGLGYGRDTATGAAITIWIDKGMAQIGGCTFSRNDASVRSLLWLRIPGEAMRDVGWIWALALPIFLAGSLFEFLQ